MRGQIESETSGLKAKLRRTLAAGLLKAELRTKLATGSSCAFMRRWRRVSTWRLNAALAPGLSRSVGRSGPKRAGQSGAAKLFDDPVERWFVRLNRVPGDSLCQVR